jgi:hypothetical protein
VVASSSRHNIWWAGFERLCLLSPLPFDGLGDSGLEKCTPQGDGSSREGILSVIAMQRRLFVFNNVGINVIVEKIGAALFPEKFRPYVTFRLMTIFVAVLALWNIGFGIAMKQQMARLPRGQNHGSTSNCIRPIS